MTNDHLVAQLQTALGEIERTPPSRMPVKTLGATVQRWDMTLAIAEHEIEQRNAATTAEGAGFDREPTASIVEMGCNLQRQIGLAYEILPAAERQRILATLEQRYCNAVKAHTMRERHVDGPAAQPSLIGFGTSLPRAS